MSKQLTSSSSKQVAGNQFSNVPKWLQMLVAAYPYTKANSLTLELFLKTFSPIPVNHLEEAVLQHTLHSRFFPTISDLASTLMRVLRGSDLHAANILQFLMSGYKLLEENKSERYLKFKTPEGADLVINF